MTQWKPAHPKPRIFKDRCEVDNCRQEMNCTCRNCGRALCEDHAEQATFARPYLPAFYCDRDANGEECAAVREEQEELHGREPHHAKNEAETTEAKSKKDHAKKWAQAVEEGK